MNEYFGEDGSVEFLSEKDLCNLLNKLNIKAILIYEGHIQVMNEKKHDTFRVIVFSNKKTTRYKLPPKSINTTARRIIDVLEHKMPKENKNKYDTDIYGGMSLIFENEKIVVNSRQPFTANLKII